MKILGKIRYLFSTVKINPFAYKIDQKPRKREIAKWFKFVKSCHTAC